jgi:hypothetical protein
VQAIDALYKMWISDLNAALPDPNPSYADLADTRAGSIAASGP